MSHHTAKGVGLDGGHRMKNILDDGTANGSKGIAVIKTKWRELVALAADIQGFTQGLFTPAG